MELIFENTKAGTKVYDGKKHVKTIPKRYEADFGFIEIDFSKKGLQEKKDLSLNICFSNEYLGKMKNIYMS